MHFPGRQLCQNWFASLRVASRLKRGLLWKDRICSLYVFLFEWPFQKSGLLYVLRGVCVCVGGGGGGGGGGRGGEGGRGGVVRVRCTWLWPFPGYLHWYVSMQLNKQETTKVGRLSWQKWRHIYQVYLLPLNDFWQRYKLVSDLSGYIIYWDWLIVLGFNDTSTLEGHFVSSPREREKRDRRESRGDEREGQGRKRNRNESEGTEEIKTFPLYPYPLQG